MGGHAEVGSRAELERYLEYMRTLHAAVRDGMLEGKSLETLQQEIKLPAYSDWKMYDAWLPLNIEGVYRQLRADSYLLNREKL